MDKLLRQMKALSAQNWSPSPHLSILVFSLCVDHYFLSSFGQPRSQHCPASTCSHLPSVSCKYQTVWRYCLARDYQKRKSRQNFPCGTYYAHPLHHDITGSVRLQLILGVATVTAVYRRQLVALLQAVNQLPSSVPWLWHAVFCTAILDRLIFQQVPTALQSETAWILESRVRIPLTIWMFVSRVCCVQFWQPSLRFLLGVCLIVCELQTSK